MKQYNLTPLAEEWFTAQFDALVENKQDNARHVEFDVRAFTRFVIHYINDYHARHNWSQEVQKTPSIVHYQERQIYRILGKTSKNDFLTKCQ